MNFIDAEERVQVAWHDSELVPAAAGAAGAAVEEASSNRSWVSVWELDK